MTLHNCVNIRPGTYNSNVIYDQLFFLLNNLFKIFSKINKRFYINNKKNNVEVNESINSVPLVEFPPIFLLANKCLIAIVVFERIEKTFTIFLPLKIKIRREIHIEMAIRISFTYIHQNLHICQPWNISVVKTSTG